MEKVETKVQVNEKAVAKTAEDKAKKAASARAWKEKKNAENVARQETAKKFIAFLNEKKVQLPAEYAKFLDNIANPAGRASNSQSVIFTKIFGDTPKVGQSVKLIDIFSRTYKSKADIDRLVKQWADKGTVVKYTANNNVLDSVYTIESLAK